MSEIIVKKAEYSDVPQIAEIEMNCIPQPWSEAAFAEALEDEKAVTLAAFCGGILCGFITGVYLLDMADIYSCAVSAEYRKKGVGKRLLEEFFSALPDGVNSVGLEVRENNIPAIKLYEKTGFERVGLRKDFYREPRENAVLMTKILNKRLP
ncbi:MAG: ribosomal protein S18-alanine N-acetyltransferase [Oscillospiraceae bacterium]|nr:ribosomal protein S18-alanine N-acetyltransferase [Oscillospiraceae bacterium]